MAIEQHRNTEHLGGIVNLLTIDATELTENPGHIRRYVNNYGADGLGVTYQGNLFSRNPYQIAEVRKSAKAKRQGTKINIAGTRNSSFYHFLNDVGGNLEGARIYEYRVYERYLDDGVEPNALAYIKRLDHRINYLEESDRDGEIIIHTIDPLSKDINVPSIAFSAGVPNSTESFINVFPAADRRITEGR